MNSNNVFITFIAIGYICMLTFNSLIFKDIVGINEVVMTTILTFFYVVFVLLIRTKFKLSYLYLFLVVSCFFSIILNDIPPYFKSEFRFVGWLLLILALSPLANNKFVGKIRYSVFNLLITFFILITFISFLYSVLGFPNLGMGHFTGIMVHSMILAPISAISSICCVVRGFQASSIIKKQIYFLLTLITLYILFLSGSRGALVGCFLVFIVMFLLSKARFKFIIFTFVSVSFTIGVFLSGANAPGSSGVMEDRGNTREFLWLNRIVEFQSSPIIGIGFASERELKLLSSGERQNNEIGTVEPGSGYLMVLSMTGAAGFIFFVSILGKNVYQLYKHIQDDGGGDSKHIFYVLLFFCLHFIGEGYVYAFGSLMCATFWLLLGAARYSLVYNNSVELDFKRYLQ